MLVDLQCNSSMINYFNSTATTFEFVVKYLVELISWINISDTELEEIVKHAISKNDLDQLVSTLWVSQLTIYFDDFLSKLIPSKSIKRKL